MFQLNITFAAILSSKEYAKLPVTLSFAFFINSNSGSENTKLIINLSIALTRTHSVLS